MDDSYSLLFVISGVFHMNYFSLISCIYVARPEHTFTSPASDRVHQSVGIGPMRNVGLVHSVEIGVCELWGESGGFNSSLRG